MQQGAELSMRYICRDMACEQHFFVFWQVALTLINIMLACSSSVPASTAGASEVRHSWSKQPPAAGSTCRPSVCQLQVTGALSFTHCSHTHTNLHGKEGVEP